MDQRQQKISVILRATELARFNAYCRDKGFKKSTLISRLIREHLDHEKFPSADHHDPLSAPAAGPGIKARRRSRSREGE